MYLQITGGRCTLRTLHGISSSKSFGHYTRTRVFIKQIADTTFSRLYVRIIGFSDLFLSNLWINSYCGWLDLVG